MTLKRITMAKTKGPKSHRYSCRQPNALAPHGARDEPGETCDGPRANIPAGQKYEKGANRMGSSRRRMSSAWQCRSFSREQVRGFTNRTVVPCPQPIATISSRARKVGGSRRRLCAYVYGVHRRIVDLVNEIAGESGSSSAP
jgi:hypothetical protein